MPTFNVMVAITVKADTAKAAFDMVQDEFLNDEGIQVLHASEAGL